MIHKQSSQQHIQMFWKGVNQREMEAQPVDSSLNNNSLSYHSKEE